VKILAVDTALGACSVAVLDHEAVCAHRLEPMERGHAERLAPMVREAMEEANLDFAAIGRLAVTIGPGTFTGQRVGYAFMRGLRLALHRPLVGVTTLAAMAEAALAETGARGAAVLHDARRGEVYVTAVTNGEVIMPAQLMALEETINKVSEATRVLEGPLALAGTASPLAIAALRALGRNIIETEIRTPDALWVARLARLEPEPPTVPRPLYLRPPDAQLPAGRP
jgi:tRNA threonylcarbamoyladenosine biosynthesis protein TsaB